MWNVSRQLAHVKISISQSSIDLLCPGEENGQSWTYTLDVVTLDELVQQTLTARTSMSKVRENAKYNGRDTFSPRFHSSAERMT